MGLYSRCILWRNARVCWICNRRVSRDMQAILLWLIPGVLACWWATPERGTPTIECWEICQLELRPLLLGSPSTVVTLQFIRLPVTGHSCHTHVAVVVTGTLLCVCVFSKTMYVDWHRYTVFWPYTVCLPNTKTKMSRTHTHFFFGMYQLETRFARIMATTYISNDSSL